MAENRYLTGTYAIGAVTPALSAALSSAFKSAPSRPPSISTPPAAPTAAQAAATKAALDKALAASFPKSPTPPPMKPPVDPATKSKVNSAASAASSAARKLRTAAGKSKTPRHGSKLSQIADSLDQKANSARSKVSVAGEIGAMMSTTADRGGGGTGGPSAGGGMVPTGTGQASTAQPAMNAMVDTTALLNLASSLTASSSEADALVTANDIANQLTDYINRLTALNLQSYLTDAQALAGRASVLITNYPTGGSDPTFPGQVASLQTDFNNWARTANLAIGKASPVVSGDAPTITTVVDSAGANVPGDQVTITGTNLTGVTAVDFNGTPTLFNPGSATQITAIIPQGATTGPIHVVTPAGTATSPSVFTPSAAAPPPPAPTPDAGGGGGGSGGGGGGDPFGDSDGADAGADAGDFGADGGGLDDSNVDWGDGSNQEQGDGGLAPAPSDGGGLTDDGGLLDSGDGSSQQSAEDVMGSNPYMIGAYVLGASGRGIGVDTTPAAVSYTDQPTVLAVQKALVARGYLLKPTRTVPDGCDGIFGSDTSRAIKAAQKDAGLPTTGVVDYGVLSMLKVPAPAYTPTTSTAGRSGSAAAQDADAVASAAQTPAQVQAASQQVQAANAVALPPPPPDVQEKVAKAAIAAKTAVTPEQVTLAKQQVQEAAQALVVAQSFWGTPLWTGAPIRRWQAAVAGGATIVAGFGLALLVRRR